MRPLRVLTIGHSYIIPMNRAIARSVSRDPGIDVTIAAPRKFAGDLRPLTIEPEPASGGAELRPLDASLTRAMHIFRYRWRDLAALVREGKFDVVHAWEEPYIFAGYEIARAVGPTTSRFCFRTAQSLVKNYPFPFGWFEKQVVSRSQGWIAGGNLVYQAMLQRGFPAGRGRVLTLGVDAERFRPLPDAERRHVREKLGLAGPVIGFVGRFVPAKGLTVLMQALERVRSPWSLLLLGSGPMDVEIQQWAKRRGLADRVKLMLARHDEVPSLLNAMDMLVAPSQTTAAWAEQFGRMVIEAFACGVPVIGSRSGEIPYVIDDAGLVVDEANVPAWTSAIERLLESEAERRRLGDAGLARCMDKYAASKIAQQYAAYYRELAAQPL